MIPEKAVADVIMMSSPRVGGGDPKLGKKFLKKVFDDEYRTYEEVNKNTFKNFEQITDDYTSDELEDMAMRKQKEGFKRLGVEI